MLAAPHSLEMFVVVRRETGFFLRKRAPPANAYTSQKLGLNFCLTLML